MMVMGFWGISKREAWLQFCEETSAEFIDGGFWKRDRVELMFQSWMIVLDTYVVSSGKSSTTYTRIRTPIANPSGFRFRVCRQGFFNGLAKLFGAQDIEIGDPKFDEEFIVQTNDEWQVAQLLALPHMKDLFYVQPQIDIQIRDDEGFWGPTFPEYADELYFVTHGTIRDVERLKNLFDLFGEILMQLAEAKVIDSHDPGVVLS